MSMGLVGCGGSVDWLVVRHNPERVAVTVVCLVCNCLWVQPNFLWMLLNCLRVWPFFQWTLLNNWAWPLVDVAELFAGAPQPRYL